MSIENGLPFIFWVKVTAIWRQEVVWDFLKKKMSFICHFSILNHNRQFNDDPL